VTRAAAAGLILCAASVAAAPADERFASATLENGSSVGFALVRTGASGNEEAIGEAVLPRSNVVSRVLWDGESGAYFGYRVEVSRESGPRPFRVSFRALDRSAIERELKKRWGCPGCPPPTPLGGGGPRFPAPQRLDEGEALTLELLSNPRTGQRIFDVLRVSAQPISTDSMRSARSRVLEGQEAVLRAAAHFTRHRYAAAVTEYHKALAVQPYDASIHNLLGICYQQMKDDDKARKEYERALELSPAYAEVWNNIGTLEQSREKFRQAVRAYKKAIEMKPGLATPWKNLGNAYFAMGRVQEAFESWQEAFRLDPTILESQGTDIPAMGVDVAEQSFYLAKLLAANGHVDAALEFLARAVDAGFRDFDRVEGDKAFKAVVESPRYRELREALPK
jgi:tetratricopeptide (TPR) repeat protein